MMLMHALLMKALLLLLLMSDDDDDNDDKHSAEDDVDADIDEGVYATARRLEDREYDDKEAMTERREGGTNGNGTIRLHCWNGREKLSSHVTKVIGQTPNNNSLGFVSRRILGYMEFFCGVIVGFI